MAGKDKKPSSGKTPSAARAAALLNTPVSTEVRDLLGSPARPQSAENKAASEAARALLGSPASPDVAKLLKGEDTEFQNFARSLLKGGQVAPEDTLDPGESFEQPTALQLLTRKLALTETEVLLAAPPPEQVAALRMGVVTNRDNSDRVYMSPKAMNDLLTSGGVPGAKNLLTQTFPEAQRAIANRYIGLITEIDPGTLHPGLLNKMLKDADVADYVNYAINAGNKAGINGIMYANQLYQESRFEPDAVSGKGARGISQMMPFQQGKYGLTSRADFFDPYKSIDAGAAMMFEMTNKYKDQRLALVAYNGGERAIQFVEAKLGKGQITYPDWHGFMENRRSTNPTNDPSAWQNETKHYVDVIAGRPSAQERKTGVPEPALK